MIAGRCRLLLQVFFLRCFNGCVDQLLKGEFQWRDPQGLGEGFQLAASGLKLAQQQNAKLRIFAEERMALAPLFLGFSRWEGPLG